MSPLMCNRSIFRSTRKVKPPRMRRRGKNVRELLKEKTKRKELNWGEFNFLENLLVSCLLSGRSVPKESGIGFTLTLDEGDSSLCLLFKIDRNRDPLVRDPQTP